MCILNEHRWFNCQSGQKNQCFGYCYCIKSTASISTWIQETFFSLTENHEWKASGQAVMTMSDSYAGSFPLLKLDLITMKHLRHKNNRTIRIHRAVFTGYCQTLPTSPANHKGHGQPSEPIKTCYKDMMRNLGKHMQVCLNVLKFISVEKIHLALTAINWLIDCLSDLLLALQSRWISIFESNFTSDWIKKWYEYFQPIKCRSNAKPIMHRNLSESRPNIALEIDNNIIHAEWTNSASTTRFRHIFCFQPFICVRT